jgi:hypothetical protein
MSAKTSTRRTNGSVTKNKPTTTTKYRNSDLFKIDFNNLPKKLESQSEFDQLE